MCDFTKKLTAWLDGELAANDAADVERHLQLCPQCREQIEAYRRASGAFDRYCDAYCEAVTASRPRRKTPRRVLAASAAAAVAAAVAALVFLAPRPRIPLSPARAAMASRPLHTAASRPAAQPAAAPVETLPSLAPRTAQQTGQRVSRPQGQEANWLPDEPAVEIAIPADAIFPPGAVPAGVSFTADVTIAPDGSAQQIRLQPQLTEFERRSTRP